MSVGQNAAKSSSSARPRGRGFSFYEKMAFLYFLNLADWLCTEALLMSGRFFEANPLMRPVMDGFWQTLLIKGAAPLALVIICCVLYRLSGGIESRLGDALIYTGIALYSLVLLWHIFNFVLLFSTF